MSIADKLTTIAENEQKVYDKGVEDGKKAEYDAFWDNYQNYGKETNCSLFFGGNGWDEHNTRPKYDIKPVNMYMFTYNANNLSSFDWVAMFEQQGIVLDTSNCTEFTYAFLRGSHWGVIDTTKTTNLNVQMFFYANMLHTIDELIVKETTIYGTNTFVGTTALKNLKISGTIGRTITLAQSPLTVESAKSVINALKNYAGTDNALKYKLTLKSTVWDALNEAEAPPVGDTWQDYVSSLGWNYA